MLGEFLTSDVMGKLEFLGLGGVGGRTRRRAGEEDDTNIGKC